MSEDRERSDIVTTHSCEKIVGQVLNPLIILYHEVFVRVFECVMHLCLCAIFEKLSVPPIIINILQCVMVFLVDCVILLYTNSRMHYRKL